MRVGKHPDWKGPPAQQAIYGAFRANAVDVVYGTVEGFETSRRALHGAGPSEGEVVTWRRRKKSTSPSSAPVPPAAIFADVLARAGKKVVLLEFGPDWDYKQFVSSEIWGKRLKHAPRFQLAGRNNPGHGSNAGWGTGGAMIHFFANWPRMHPVDFRVKSQYGKGLDWPISYDELSPWYDRIAEDIGVSGDAAAERRWYPVGKDYPMPPLKNFRAGDDLQRRVQGARHSAGADAGRHQQHRRTRAGRPA